MYPSRKGMGACRVYRTRMQHEGRDAERYGMNEPSGPQSVALAQTTLHMMGGDVFTVEHPYSQTLALAPSTRKPEEQRPPSALQSWHGAPARPHATFCVPTAHTLPRQHPAQLLALHVPARSAVAAIHRWRARLATQPAAAAVVVLRSQEALGRAPLDAAAGQRHRCVEAAPVAVGRRTAAARRLHPRSRYSRSGTSYRPRRSSRRGRWGKG